MSESLFVKPVQRNILDKTVEEVYLDYFNNYLTIEKFAADNYISCEAANNLINALRAVREEIIDHLS